MTALDRWLHDGWLRPVDHAFASALRRLRDDTDPRVALAAAFASRALAFGHGALPLRDVAALCAEIDPSRPPLPLPDPEAWADALAASPWVDTAADPATRPGADGAPLVFDGERVWLRRYFAFECAVAGALRGRAASPLPPPDPAWEAARLQGLFPLLADDPADRQAAAARALARERVLLLTGGPGTGKTTTVARALVLAVEAAQHAGGAPPRVALAAPTGKAATRLSESLRAEVAALVAAGALSAEVAAGLPADASTLHRLLGWRTGRAARHDADEPLPLDLLVVDEASMVDLPMMARLLAALPPAARLLLVGDPDQLPSVDTGDVLAALAASPLPQVRLTRVHRQRDAGTLNALAMHVRDADAALALLAASTAAADLAGANGRATEHVRWCSGDESRLLAEVLAQALPAYRAVRDAATPAEALRQAREFRVLTALREGPAGSVALNAHIAAALQPAAARARLFDGLLLMITANSPRHGLYNGDVGVVRVDADGEARAWFDGADGVRAWLPSALPPHEPAYALTVHKSQGSEFGRVLLVLPDAGSRVLSRELLYTGLTRARSAVTLWARDAALREAIARRADRWSGLAAKLGVAGA